jgi:hypothetical protein
MRACPTGRAENLPDYRSGTPAFQRSHDMSVFSKIFDKIFRRAEAATPAGTAPSSTTASGGTAASTAPQAGGGGTAVMQEVDVEAVLNGLAAQNSQKLNWRTSIVDLMKLLDLDSSLQERKELATELGYTGAKDGSAEMNLWLHKQVMKKLAANGGKVPADLKD